eukprot:Hpha_TRINITY_DN16126_c1_g2::TRINITY_DN16126_c1_g2_i1::g.8493::m.8493
MMRTPSTTYTTLLLFVLHDTMEFFDANIIRIAGATQAPTGGCAVRTLHATSGRTCVINFDNTLRCWGQNDASTCQLGIGDSSNRGDSTGSMGHGLPFVNVSLRPWYATQMSWDYGAGSIAIPQLSIGGLGGCVMITPTSGDFEVKCWGDGTTGYNGGETTADIGCSTTDVMPSIPVPVSMSCIAVQIVSTSSHSCLLCDDQDTVYCWGSGTGGALGGSTGAEGTDNLGGTTGWGSAWVPADIAGEGRIVRLVDSNGGGGLSESFMCILGDNDRMKCWGKNNVGQLGYGDTQSRGEMGNTLGTKNAWISPGPGGGSPIVDACLGAEHVLVLYDTGEVEAWGGGSYEQLGNELGPFEKLEADAVDLALVAALSPDSPASVHCGGYHSCVMNSGKTKVSCWGRNNNGQLGMGDTVSRGADNGDMATLTALQIGTPAVTNYAALALGTDHSCLLASDYSVYCWGGGAEGQLGSEGTSDVTSTSSLSAVDLACPTESPTVSPSVPPSTSTPSVSPTTSAPTVSPSTSAPTVSPSVSPSTSAPTVSPTVSPSTSTP